MTAWPSPSRSVRFGPTAATALLARLGSAQAASGPTHFHLRCKCRGASKSHLSSAVSVAWPVSSSSWAMDRAFPFLTKLLAKTPYAERNQDDGKNRQRQEIGPQRDDPTSF